MFGEKLIQNSQFASLNSESNVIFGNNLKPEITIVIDSVSQSLRVAEIELSDP